MSKGIKSDVDLDEGVNDETVCTLLFNLSIYSCVRKHSDRKSISDVGSSNI